MANLRKQLEKFSETKKRLEKRTGIKGKSFEKIKFAVVRRAQFSRPQYLNDGRLLIPAQPRQQIYGIKELTWRVHR